MNSKRSIRLCSLFLAVLMIVSIGGVGVFSAFAAGTESGYTYISDASKKTAQITGYNGSSHTLSIPSKLDGYTVTSIKAEAFKGKNTILSIEIPSTVTTIGSECFSGCTLLGTVTLGSGVSTIGAKAFQDCVVLTTITIPSAVSSIGAQAFSGCKMLGKITVDNGNLVYMSKDDALYSKLGKTLMRYPPARTGKSYTIPDSVNIIDSFAFEGAKYPTEISMGSSVVTIREGAFKNCAALEKITLSSKVTKLSDDLFSGCKKLSALSMPTTITSIGENTFLDCAAIPSVAFPDSVTTIGANAFSGCTGLKSATIGKGVSVLSGIAFRGCTNLAEYKVADGSSNFAVQDGVLFSKDGTRLVAYPAGKSASTYTVGDKVTTIGVFAFDSCKNLKKLIIPATVKTLAKPVISNCGNTVIYVADDSAAMKYFKSETDGFSAMKVGDGSGDDEPDTPASDGVKSGDVNGDGVIDNADSMLLRRYVAGWKNVTVNKTASDVNKDGTLDNADTMILRRYIAGWKNVTLK